MGDIFGGDSTSTQKVILPQHIEEAGRHAVEIAKGVAEQPYQPYPGRRVPGLYPGFTTAANIARSQAGRSRPGIDAAGSMFQGAFKYGGVNPYLDSLWGGKGISTDSWGKSAMKQYMSPYIQGALDPVAREIRRDAEIAGRSQEDAFKSAGAFGGEREAIMAAERGRNTQQAISDLYAKGYQSAYDTALGAFTTDQARDLAAQEASARTAMGMFGQGLGAGTQYMNYELGRGNLASGDIERLLRASAPIQEHAQAEADVDYQQWLEEREWPSRALDYYLKAGQMPYGQTTTTTQPGASPFSQMLGLGLAGAGVASGFGWAPFAAKEAGGFLSGSGGGGNGYGAYIPNPSQRTDYPSGGGFWMSQDPYASYRNR